MKQLAPYARWRDVPSRALYRGHFENRRTPFHEPLRHKTRGKPRQHWSLYKIAKQPQLLLNKSDEPEQMPTFNDALKVFETKDAARFAGALFHEAFNSVFPTPAPYRILETQIQPEDWRQFVAIYTWPDGTAECVGFCNWIKYKDVYLEGGLAVQKNFYRRLSKAHFAECNARGGVAQIVMETAATTLTDCVAWFGYCGDSGWPPRWFLRRADRARPDCRGPWCSAGSAPWRGRRGRNRDRPAP